MLFLRWGKGTYGDSNDIQELNRGQEMDEALVACETVTSGEREASADAITSVLSSSPNMGS